MKLIVLTIFIVGCSLFKSKTNEKLSGHYHLYSSPDQPDQVSLETYEKRLIFVSTNDLKGQLEATQVKAKDTHSPEKTLVSVGGIEVFARYLEILRETYKNEVVLLDSGSALSGSIIARNTNGKAIVQAFSQLKYDAIGLSGDDFAAGPQLRLPAAPVQWMPQLFSQTKTPVLVSNLINLRKAEPVSWGPTTPQLLKEINGVKVGFIGLLPNDLPTKLDSTMLNGLYVEPTQLAFLRQARSLRLKGAQLIVLIKHGGISCGTKRAKEKNLPVGKVNFDPKDPDICESIDGLAKFLAELPAGSVDLVVTGGSKTKVANFINGIPVVQAFSHGSSFARVDIIWNSLEKRVMTEKTWIHQPIKLCHRFFKKTEDCFTEDNTIDHRELIPAKFLGQPIFPDSFTSFWMNEWREQFDNSPLIENPDNQMLGQEIADAIQLVTNADVAISGGSNWKFLLPQGTVGMRDLFSQPSGRESIYQVEISGEELQKLNHRLKSNAWMSHPISWSALISQEKVQLAMSEKVWKFYSKTIKTMTLPKLSQLTVSDTLIAWNQVDTVAIRASGRSPALPDTQESN
jgi:2',3'-cyclic-nucleotide 2'-phosphodiesterase (5'-nucleotidase family)